MSEVRSRPDRAAIDRRDCLRLFGAGAVAWVSSHALACTSPPQEDTDVTELALEAGPPADASDAATVDAVTAEASSTNDAGDAGDVADAHDATTFVVLYDTYAQALYFDGTYGPMTGNIRAVDVAAGADKVYEFWHGHGGIQHRFTLTAAHFADLKKKKRVNLETTTVDDHQHKLFVDPVGLTWRVPGATPLTVPA